MIKVSMPRIAVMFCAFALLVAHAHGDAYGTIEALLGRQSLNIGYDASRKSYIVIVKDRRKIPDPAQSVTFIKTRDSMARFLELDGKCEIVKSLSRHMRASDTVVTGLDGGVARNSSESKVVTSARAHLRGCRVLFSAEEWNAEEGVYGMAMAVVWSEKLERSKCADVSEFDEKFWENWARSVDLSCMVGGRQVVDERGRHFPCGIGCADVHGLKGHRYNKAVKAAEDRALQNLSFEMFADVATVEFLSERSDEMDADGDSNERFASSFCARVEAKCQKRRVRAKKVHGAVVKNPVSGRDMFVCVLAALEKEKKENE